MLACDCQRATYEAECASIRRACDWRRFAYKADCALSRPLTGTRSPRKAAVIRASRLGRFGWRIERLLIAASMHFEFVCLLMYVWHAGHQNRVETNTRSHLYDRESTVSVDRTRIGMQRLSRIGHVRINVSVKRVSVSAQAHFLFAA